MPNWIYLFPWYMPVSLNVAMLEYVLPSSRMTIIRLLKCCLYKLKFSLVIFNFEALLIVLACFSRSIVWVVMFL